MAYVPRFVHDVFLSYAHVDNAQWGVETWVGRFRDELERELRRELAVWGNRRITVWQDETRLLPGYSLNASIRSSLERTAAMICLFSPAYLASGYCADERRFFLAQCGNRLRVAERSRLLDVVIRSNADVERMVAGDTLFAKLAEDGVSRPFDTDALRSEFRRLVVALVGLLKQMRDEAPAVYVSLPSASDTETTARTCELLEDLSQAGYRRTTEIHPDFYDKDEMIEQEIGRAVLSVLVINDPADPLCRRQLDAAERSGKPIAIWLSPTARQSKAVSRIYESIPGPGREYSEGSFDEFIQRVKLLLGRIEYGEYGATIVRTPKTKRILFLYNPQKDREAGARVLRRLEAERFEVVRPGRFSDEALRESDGVLLYHESANDVWFESKLRTVSSAPRRTLKAAWTVAPPDKREALRMAQDSKFRPLVELDKGDPRLLMDGANLDSIESFVAALRIDECS